MKSNKILIVLAFLFGISPSVSWSLNYSQTQQQKAINESIEEMRKLEALEQQGNLPHQQGARLAQLQEWYSKNFKQSKSSTWGEWFSPTAWYKSMRARAGSAASSTLDMVNAVRSGIGLENITYKTFGVAIAGLIALGYSQEYIEGLVSKVYTALEPTLSAVGRTAIKVATHPAVAIPTTIGAAALTLDKMDKANEDKMLKQRIQKLGQ